MAVTESVGEAADRRRSDEGSMWTAIPADSYDAAVYDHDMFRHVLSEELHIARWLCDARTTLVEVGCGTCMFAGTMAGHVARVVGIDISERFLAAARRRFAFRTNLRLVRGDACDLVAELASRGLTCDRPVVGCVMNTLGIMSGDVRARVLRQMAQLAGPDGTVFVEVHDGAHFERAVREFYSAAPGLCGPVGVHDISYGTRELRVGETGYYSHWFSVDELRRLAEDAGVRVTRIILSGIGIFLVGHGSAEV
jgi:SAM-dependent methyltransferase